jgi:hypothetical protein
MSGCESGDLPSIDARGVLGRILPVAALSWLGHYRRASASGDKN